MTNETPTALGTEEENLRPLSRAAALSSLPMLRREADAIAEAAERLCVRIRLHQVKIDVVLEAIRRTEQ